ncbi:MAG: hypothetical protein APR63_05545 [Desulfuromonas sp. SDB]|nr:MAG: hypothetical protein APR63_05545 [Desulfuromonas sp. SDB]
MKAQKLMEAVETLKGDLEGSLIATDIWSVNQGISLAGYNSQPKAVALFNKVTDMINKTLTGSNFPELGKYYILDLVDEKMVVIIPMDEYQWGILLNSQTAPLGLLLNIAIPNAISAFEEALIG